MPWNLEASAGIPGTSVLWRGVWSSTLSYNPKDAVTGSDGSSYISKTNNTNKNPLTNPADWDLAAKKGDPGDNAWTITTEDFVTPEVGGFTYVDVEDPDWVAIGQMIVIETAGGAELEAYSYRVRDKIGNTLTIENLGTTAKAFPYAALGDMTKAVYDTDNDGVVDRSEVSDSVAWANVTGKPTTFGDVVGPASSVVDEIAVYSNTTGKLIGRLTKVQLKTDLALNNVNNTSDASKPVSTAQQAALDLKQDTSGKNSASGYAGLDGSSKIAAGQIPASAIYPAFVTLTDGATITWAVNAAQVSQNAVVTLGGARALAITGIAAGMNGTLIVKQDAAGNRTMSLPSGSKVINAGAGSISLSSAGLSIDLLTWIYDGANYFWTYGKTYT